VIPRYTRPEMAAIWSEAHTVELWLRVELAVAEAWAERGVIPADALARLREARCDIDRMRAIEREVDHEIIAFTRTVGETVGDAARYFHLGLTSSDVLDTALALQLVEASDLLLRDLDHLIAVVGEQAVHHRQTVMIGRTHGVHAEPMTFGAKLAGWYAELQRARQRLELAREEVRVGKIAGAVGTHATVPPDVEEAACSRLGLRVDPAPTQVISRDRHAFFISVLGILGSTLDRFATEVRHLQRTEVREVEEPFDPGNMGSSAMPHKRNPHESERVSGLARLLRSYVTPALENVVLWHERDISHSSVERVILPDACILADYLLAAMTEIVQHWTVYPERMRQNLDLTAGAIFSQRVLLALVNAGLARHEAYRIVQELAWRAWETGTHLRELLKADERVTSRLSPEHIDALFTLDDALRYVDVPLIRLGLLAPATASAEAEA